MIAAERCGPVRAIPIENEKVATLQPIIDKFIDKRAHLMSDEHRSYMKLGKQFAAHSHVNHSKHQYSNGAVHSNTAESFSSLFKRAQVGVFHYISKKHLSRYLNEFEFRWENRIPIERTNKKGKTISAMIQIPIIDMLIILIMRFSGFFLRRTKSWGISDFSFALT